MLREEFDDARHIGVRADALHAAGFPHHLGGARRHRRIGTALAGEAHDLVDVLAEGAEPTDARRVDTRGHARSENLQRQRIREAAGQRSGQPRGIDTGSAREGQHLRDRDEITRHDHLVAAFGELAGARPTHVRHALRQRLEHRCRTRDVVGLTTGEHDQPARTRQRQATRHRGVNPPRAARARQPFRHVARAVGRDTGEVDEQLAATQHRVDALRAEHHIVYRRGVGETQAHDVTRHRQRARRVGQRGAELHERRGLVARAIPHRHRQAALEQPLHHWGADQSRADKSDAQCGVHSRQGLRHTGATRCPCESLRR